MKVYFSRSAQTDEPVMLAIGMFDGMHTAHSALIARTVHGAYCAGIKSAVYTFSTHPSSIFAGKTDLLTPPLEKLRLIKRTDTDIAIMPPFTKELSCLLPEHFIEGLLEGFIIDTIFVGYDFRFGAGRKGDAETLKRMGKRLGFSVDVMEPHMINGQKVSSSMIREKLAQGDVQEAAKMLGRPYSASGIVVEGRRVGRTLGMPTANLKPEPGKLFPQKGVYAGWAYIEKQKLAAVTNVGTNPTVSNSSELKVETHIPGFVGNIYSKPIEIEFVHYLRGEMKFDSVDDLKAQMQRNVSETETLMRL